MSGPTREQVQSWARDARVELNFTMHRSGPIGAFYLDEFMRLMSAAYAAGQSAHAAEQPPAPLVVKNPDVVAVVAVAVRTEREACADMADELDDCMPGNPFGKLAAAIRARGAA